MRDSDVTGQKVGPDHVWGHVSREAGNFHLGDLGNQLNNHFFLVMQSYFLCPFSVSIWDWYMSLAMVKAQFATTSEDSVV